MKPIISILFLVLVTQLGSISMCMGQFPWQVKELVKGGRFDAVVDLGSGHLLMGTRKPSPGMLFRSEDYGLSWKNLGEITRNPSAIGENSITCLAKGNNGLVYMLTTNAEFWRSTDYGETWQRVKQLDSKLGDWGYSYGLWVTDKGTVLATTGRNVYRSTDHGKSFRKIGPISDKPVYRFNGVGGDIILNGWAGQVFKSTDDGISWFILAALDSMPLYATEYLGDSLYIQGAESGNVYMGNHMENNKAKRVATLNGGADDFVYLGYNRLIYSTYTEQKNVYLSSDGGYTWDNMGKVPTGIEGDWLDHMIKIERKDSVIAIGGTNKGFVLRAAFAKSDLKLD